MGIRMRYPLHERELSGRVRLPVGREVDVIFVNSVSNRGACQKRSLRQNLRQGKRVAVCPCAGSANDVMIHKFHLRVSYTLKHN